MDVCFACNLEGHISRKITDISSSGTRIRFKCTIPSRQLSNRGWRKSENITKTVDGKVQRKQIINKSSEICDDKLFIPYSSQVSFDRRSLKIHRLHPFIQFLFKLILLDCKKIQSSKTMLNRVIHLSFLSFKSSKNSHVKKENEKKIKFNIKWSKYFQILMFFLCYENI